MLSTRVYPCNPFCRKPSHQGFRLHTQTHSRSWLAAGFVNLRFVFFFVSFFCCCFPFRQALGRLRPLILPLLFSLECVLDKLTGGETRETRGKGEKEKGKGGQGRKETAGYAARASGCVAAFPLNLPICHLQSDLCPSKAPNSSLPLTLWRQRQRQVMCVGVTPPLNNSSSRNNSNSGKRTTTEAGIFVVFALSCCFAVLCCQSSLPDIPIILYIYIILLPISSCLVYGWMVMFVFAFAIIWHFKWSGWQCKKRNKSHKTMQVA